MSWQPAPDADCKDPTASGANPVELTIVPRSRDLGGFSVRRVLPAGRRQMVGPFIFFDEMGPAQLAAGTGMDVRPHPHIGLSTVTYLFEGEIFHRDTLGSALAIRPGAVNWMTAGRGIAHSERTAPGLRAEGPRLHGIQSWAALPKHAEEVAPAFVHHPAETLPQVDDGGATVRVINGTLYGATSPVVAPTETIYAEVRLAPGAQLPVDATHEERGLYLVRGEVQVGHDTFGPGQLLVLKPGAPVTVRAQAGAHLMLLGGEPMDGPRFIWWNFVASSLERIEAAKRDWREGRFGKVPGDEEELIPLPTP
jgi:redox-sensitive bicupin YhaK (pirin superfamily)